ncbi:MAG: 23S rRNA pseudouridine(955/2504/2580) synthase RluC [Candidatus Polarisedimenticolaceae bacterium]|nr:23S rRNA pseudouridine(955/2504/2580) synthase RluC [Candidatus Polarisedimenticolaceae bacterium]
MSESKQKNRSVQWVEIEEGYEGQRLDNFLMTYLKGVPKSYIYRIVRKGEVRVNKGRIKINYRLQVGDLLRIPPLRLPDEKEAVQPGDAVKKRLEASIIYEDQRFMVLNKPSGIAVHGGSGLSYGVIEALRVLRPEEKNLELVHRLDRDTSGCLLISKKRSALRILHELMRSNGMDKRYLALLAGANNWKSRMVNAPLLKNTMRGGERVVRIDEAGKEAKTHFRRRHLYADATLVEARLYTGRTHQIRVHAASLNHPVLGDQKYGDEVANKMMRKQGLRRLFLHASRLSFRWPDEQEDFVITAPLDSDLEKLLEKLSNV